MATLKQAHAFYKYMQPWYFWKDLGLTVTMLQTASRNSVWFGFYDLSKYGIFGSRMGFFFFFVSRHFSPLSGGRCRRRRWMKFGTHHHQSIIWGPFFRFFEFRLSFRNISIFRTPMDLAKFLSTRSPYVAYGNLYRRIFLFYYSDLLKNLCTPYLRA